MVTPAPKPLPEFQDTTPAQATPTTSHTIGEAVDSACSLVQGMFQPQPATSETEFQDQLGNAIDGHEVLVGMLHKMGFKYASKKGWRFGKDGMERFANPAST